MTNTSNLPVEALEVEYPLTVLRFELVDGSGGAGRFRGGMELRRVYRLGFWDRWLAFVPPSPLRFPARLGPKFGPPAGADVAETTSLIVT
jgi:Hydantoinase B/oxoprolinase